MSTCQYPPSHQAPSGKRHRNCKGYSPKRKPYKTEKGTKCCELNKDSRPSTGPKCGTVVVRGRGRVPVYRGSQGGVYYLTQTNDKTYIDSKDNIHKKPKRCGPGAKSPKRRAKSPKRRAKSPKRRAKSPKGKGRAKSPKGKGRAKSPKGRAKSPKKRHGDHLHVTSKTLKNAIKKAVLHKHSKCKH